MLVLECTMHLSAPVKACMVGKIVHFIFSLDSLMFLFKPHRKYNYGLVNSQNNMEEILITILLFLIRNYFSDLKELNLP